MRWLIRFLMRRVPRPFLIRFSGLFSSMVKPFYAGNSVECPVCSSTFRKFLPYGIMGRSNVLCPACLSLERHRLLWLYLKEQTDFFSASRTLLHVAPEQCFIERFRKLSNIVYTTADLESPIVDMHFDLHSIPLPDEQFDAVICNHVLEHVKDDRMVLKEVFRILKRGGFTILQVPLDYDRESTFEDSNVILPRDRERLFGQKDHLRMYGKDYPVRLREAGFMVGEIHLNETIDASLHERYRLPEKEVIYWSTRP